MLPASTNKMGDKESQSSVKDVKSVDLIDTVAYLSFYYAKNYSTTYQKCMGDYAAKFTNKVILDSIKKWKKTVEDNGLVINGQIALTNSQSKDTMWKTLKTLAESTIQCEDTLKITIYPEMNDMALVIGHFDNTATVRIMEAQRAQAEKFEAKILDLTKKLNDCIN